jgi:hypothetical protein
MSERHDTRDADWPLRPWIMAAICAVAGLIFDFLTELDMSKTASAAEQAGATFVAIAAVSFVMTVEQRRWTWSLGFALGWGAVVALVGWFTASYNQNPTIFEWPFLSGVFAVLLAAPLFQTVSDEGAWRFPYARLHSHAWTDAVIGAAALGFVGVTFLLAWLIAGLFDLIGIDLVKDALRESWFGWMLAGFAFGAAVGLLRERDALVGTLQRLVMVVLGVLAPVLAAALALFLLSLPFTGLDDLWDSPLPATGLMLLAGAGAVLLANAVIGNGEDDRAPSRLLRLSALVLVLVVMPLAIIAAVSIGARIEQHGWTPERIWGVVAVGVAIAYGVAGWWAIARGRERFDEPLRPLQTRLAIGLCGLALLLALPIVDFGAISARSQVDRLAAGKMPTAEFDWRAMAFDFGPAGRRALDKIARGGPPEQRPLAAAALSTKNRYEIEAEVAKTGAIANLDRYLRVVPAEAAVSAKLREAIGTTRFCREKPCILAVIDTRRAIVAGRWNGDEAVQSQMLKQKADGSWAVDVDMVSAAPVPHPAASTATTPAKELDLARAPVELRSVERRQLYIDGKPVGAPFE